jgi:hypothetical protein
MATEAERIRKEIASTRAELTRDVDRLAHETSPGRLAGRAIRSAQDQGPHDRHLGAGGVRRGRCRIRGY